MKAMLLNALQQGGAAQAALRLLKGLQGREVDARLLVQRKTDDDPSVIGPGTKTGKTLQYIWPRLEWLCVWLCALRRGCSFSPALMPDMLPRKVADFDPDIVHLHWITNGFMRVETCSRFHRPLVWTLHDSWAFTGGCHLPGECTRYKESCGKCPVLRSSLSHDLSRWVWRRKRRAWRDMNMTVVAPSRWLAKCAKESSLFRNARVEVIPNGVDLETYKPVDKRIARERLSFPQEKKLILFSGKSGLSDRNKGFHILVEALRVLADRGWRNKAEVVILGSAKPERPPDLGLKSNYVGWLKDDDVIALLYAACDVCVVSSIQENLSYTVMESLACGTPCVAFNQGGMPDLIDHGDNGYLGRPFDIDDLAGGIAWVLGDGDRWKALSFRARQKVEREFALNKVAGRYVELYREILDSVR